MRGWPRVALKTSACRSPAIARASRARARPSMARVHGASASMHARGGLGRRAAARPVADGAAALEQQAVARARRRARPASRAVQLLARHAQPRLGRAQVALVGAHAHSLRSRTMCTRAAAWYRAPKKKRCSWAARAVDADAVLAPPQRGAPLQCGFSTGSLSSAPTLCSSRSSSSARFGCEPPRTSLTVRGAHEAARLAARSPRPARASRSASTRCPAAPRTAAIVGHRAAQAAGAVLAARLHRHRLRRLRVRGDRAAGGAIAAPRRAASRRAWPEQEEREGKMLSTKSVSRGGVCVRASGAGGGRRARAPSLLVETQKRAIAARRWRGGRGGGGGGCERMSRRPPCSAARRRRPRPCRAA